MLYIGSCRYMYEYIWDYFPGRLHTTKEIIFFLENIDNIENVINCNPSELTNMIFGDIFNSDVINDSKRYLNNINKKIKKLILEVSSKKVYYYNDIPLNYFYTNNNKSLITKYNLKNITLTDDEINTDLDYIINLSKKIFDENIEIHIIPHLNLKTKSLNNYIYERDGFVKLLEELCKIKKINIHNIGKYIENNNHDSNDTNIFIEDYMADSCHYSKGYDIIKQFLISKIY
jgi:hypothetical protein